MSTSTQRCKNLEKNGGPQLDDWKNPAAMKGEPESKKAQPMSKESAATHNKA